MTSPPLLTWLTRLVRRQPAPPAEVLDPYAASVLPLVDRAEALFHQWFEYTALVADSEKLANAAAIHRWEAATMARSLERITPPAELVHDHARLVAAIHLASRASQLLSSGSRYHNANALCEGQMLLTESRTRRLKALALLRRFVTERAATTDRAASLNAAPAADEGTSVSAAPAEPAPSVVEASPADAASPIDGPGAHSEPTGTTVHEERRPPG